MKFSRVSPSDAKTITDQETGIKLSDRDITILSSSVNTSASLIKFGTSVYNRNKNSDSMFLTYDVPNKGVGFVSYTLGDTVEINEIHADCISSKENAICIEALTETVYNICKSLNKTLEVKSDSKDFKNYIANRNQLYKEQKLEDKYYWKTE